MSIDVITLKGIIDEDFVNYKVPSMSLMFPYCDFKCGKDVCQNIELATQPDLKIHIATLCERYLNNPITRAVVCQGLEPLNSKDELLGFIDTLRNQYECNDDIVIYTGYKESEVDTLIEPLLSYDNIIIKFGRYISNSKSRYDELLGINLASENQYAKRISLVRRTNE